MFKKKHKYEVAFADGSVRFVEGYDISIFDDDNDQTKGDVFIKGNKSSNDVAWYRKETLKYIVKVG